MTKPLFSKHPSRVSDATTTPLSPSNDRPHPPTALLPVQSEPYLLPTTCRLIGPIGQRSLLFVLRALGRVAPFRFCSAPACSLLFGFPPRVAHNRTTPFHGLSLTFLPTPFLSSKRKTLTVLDTDLTRSSFPIHPSCPTNTTKRRINMATRPDSAATPRRRITTYSKHFKRRPVQEERGIGGRISTAPVESSVWDFHDDDDEIASPVVTLGRSKSKRTQTQARMRPISEVGPSSSNQASARSGNGATAGAASNPKKRRASVGRDIRAFSTPPSPPSSAEERMPPPKSIPLPKPIKAPRPARRTNSLGSKKSPTTQAMLGGNYSRSLPYTFAAGKSLNDLTSNKSKKQVVQTHIPFRPSNAPPRTSGFARRETASTSNMRPTTSDSLNTTAPRKRRRLIDELAAQADETSGDDENAASGSRLRHTRRTPSPEPMVMPPLFQSPPPAPTTPASRPRTFARQDSAKKTGPKFTYSNRRTIRAENSMLGDMDPMGDKAWLKESLLPTATSQFDMDEDEEQPFSAGAVRSIHELRQAGANSRSADEIEDLLTRVGRPNGKSSSSRRNALIELSQKMQDKNFVRRFRDHNGDRSLYEQVGKETDVITGYALVAILTTLLATTASTHIIGQLQGQGFSLLLERLFAISTDIQALAKDRNSNLSRNGQQAMMKLKASLLILPVWQPTTPFMLSPRRLALKAFELVVKNAGAIGDEFFSSGVTDRLFALLKQAPVPDAWGFPHQDESIDFQLALSLLESHSVYAMQGDSKETWTLRHLPVIADTLRTTLRRSKGRWGEIAMLILKFTLNTSNNNHDAPAAFIEKDTVRLLANTLCDTFTNATNLVYDPDAFTSQLEVLLLMLGIMINFSENDRATSRSLLDAHKGGQAPLDRLIKLFLDHHVATAEVRVDPVQKVCGLFGLLTAATGGLGGEESVECCLWLPVATARLHVAVCTRAAAIQLHAQDWQPGPSSGRDSRVHCVSPCGGQRNRARGGAADAAL